MAYTFEAAKGVNIGDSLCEKDKIDLAKELLAKAKARNVNLLLPIDTVVADQFSNDANSKVVEGDIEAGWQGPRHRPQDPRAVRERRLRPQRPSSETAPWAFFEMEKFAEGTKAVAKARRVRRHNHYRRRRQRAAVQQLGFADKMTHISTGGGASLEFLEGLELPGVACLNDK